MQFAKLAGARTVVTSSDYEKFARACELGAEYVINYKKHRECSQSQMDAAAIMRSSSAGTMNCTLEALRFGGSVSLMGVLKGFADAVATGVFLHKNIRIQGTCVGSVFEDMDSAIAHHRLKPVIDRIYLFEQIVDVLAHLGSGKHFGTSRGGDRMSVLR